MNELHPTYGFIDVDNDACFLCGKSNSSMTDEHVFPKWLQTKFNLWDQRLTLLNGTYIQYKFLYIPCCADCNGGYLSRLETKIRDALEGGYATCMKLDHLTWQLWAGKLFYGTLRKEINLLLSRRNPENGTIVTEEVLKSFSNHHMFLQAIREKVVFSDPIPYSVIVCNLHDLGAGNNYHYADDLNTLTLSIRFGEVGIIVAFQDAGLLSDTYGKYVSEVNGRKLHPIQFDELYSKVIYQTSLIDRPPTFSFCSHSEGESPATVDMISCASKIHAWSQKNYANVLYQHIAKWNQDITMEDLFVEPDLVETWMSDKEGKLKLLEMEEWETVV